MQLRMGKWISQLFSGVRYGLARMGTSAANLRRRIFVRHLPDYVVMTLDQPLSERAPHEPWWYHYVPGRRSPLSLEELDRRLARVARDPVVKGVVFLVKGGTLTMAQAQSMHALLARFRDRAERACGASKRAVVYLESVGSATYVFACAADTVIVPPLASWDVTGLHVAPVYLKDTLARLGVQMEVVKIAPWKTAADALSRSEMSDEARAQLNWLLDSLYRDVVNAIVAGRGLDAVTVLSLIDRAPMSATKAQAAGLVDIIGYEDELSALLGESVDGEVRSANLRPYDQVWKLLMRKAVRRTQRAVGVIALEGSIITGESRQFPVPLPVAGESTIGSSTTQQLVRAAAADDGLAAVVVFVDSGGGSALASDLIWRELARLNEKKPVIVYMGNTAASGGYYIAAPARRIVAQSATLTGSIGVIVAKAVVAGALDKVDARVHELQRGANAALYDALHGWTESQRSAVAAEVEQVYAAFKQRVAEGRRLPYAGLDDICNGRVWTGSQAHALGLVDVVGDFHAAYELACAAAELPVDGRVPTRRVTPPRHSLPATTLQEAAALLFPGRMRRWGDLTAALPGGSLMQAVRRERIWLLTETMFRIDG